MFFIFREPQKVNKENKENKSLFSLFSGSLKK